VASRSTAMRCASVQLRGDKAFVLAAVAERGAALEHVSDALRADKEVVLTAVAQYGWALRYASTALRQQPALQHIKRIKLDFTAAELRLCMAVALLAPDAKQGVCAIALCPADVIELICAGVTRDTLLQAITRKYGYWQLAGATVDFSPSRKRPRLQP
jgi:hypothetical protein